jgi:Plasmid pRiA4b ORF-3-like protein
MAKTARHADDIIRLKVTLRGIRPPIWRRLALPGRMTLGDLHHAIQAAMGWDDGHLHPFDLGVTAIRSPSTGSPTRSG